MPRPVSGTARENVVSTRLSAAEFRAVQAQAGGNRAAWLRQAVRAALGVAPMGTPAPPIPPEERPATPARPRAGTSRPDRPIQRRRGPNRPKPEPVDEPAPHRHKREKVGEKWIGGQDVGEWRCGDPDCGVVLGAIV